MAAADLVVCRAGAITLSEIQCCGKASVLIPSPYVAENHQYHNAMTLAENGGAILIEEKYLSEKKITDIVLDLKNNREKLSEISQKCGEKAKHNALSEICRIITSLNQ